MQNEILLTKYIYFVCLIRSFTKIVLETVLFYRSIKIVKILLVGRLENLLHLSASINFPLLLIALEK